ncbi:ABC transporter permease [Phaeacidiphilus oryzae]|uniref:ABC transporter permease n=1 Tax=Phaeacidiphilus oryzae TaxID=348818 RepID=UPI0009FE9869|nr:ABC transporter permease [Phaeacidiphilus oryzae]
MSVTTGTGERGDHVSAEPFEPSRWRRWSPALARHAAAIGLLGVFVVFFIATPDFLTVGNITDLLVSAAILVVLALGQQVVIVAAGIDLSVGANLPWAAVLFGEGMSHGWGVTASTLLSIAGAGAVGLVNGLVTAVAGVTDFIATLGSLSVVSGISLLLTAGNTTPVSSPFLRRLALDGIGPVRWFWLVAAVVAAAVWLGIARTRTGTHLLATGGNLEAAREAGIPVARMRVLAYTASGLLCGLAGVLYVARTGGADPTLQTDFLLSSIAAVVLGGSSLFGGQSAVLGTVAGAVLLTALVNGFTILGISQYYQPIAVGGVVVAAAVLSRFKR